MEHPSIQVSIGQQFVFIGDAIKEIEDHLPAAKRAELEQILISDILKEFLPPETQPSRVQPNDMMLSTTSSHVIPSGHSDDSLVASKNILMIGITGSGKSALGNLLCYPDHPFSISDSAHSNTKRHRTHQSSANEVRVTDTMGFLDTELTMEENIKGAVSAVNHVRDGIDAILYVAKFGRMAQVEVDALKLVIDAILGNEACNNLVLVLTHLQESAFATSRERQNAWLRDQSRIGHAGFNEMLKLCQGRVAFVFNPSKDSSVVIESANQSFRSASRENVMRAINSITSSRFLPEMAREAQTKYGERQHKLQEERARAQTEADLAITNAAILELQEKMNVEMAERLNQKLLEQNESLSEFRLQVMRTAMNRQQSANSPMVRIAGAFMDVGVKAINSAGDLAIANSCSIM